MSLNINLFVHGVPLGQKMWGPKEGDQKYISSFYGPKWNAPEVMKIDIMTFGGVPYCYYTFVKGQKIYDFQGRDGSYFALTLRMNAFYYDVQNMYNILKATYDKMCVGLCVTEKDGSTKYLLTDFQNIDDKLRSVEKHLLDYISEFSISNDIIQLNGISVGGQGIVKTINLHECTGKVALEEVRRSSSLMVSPWYLSNYAERIVAQYKEEMQKTTEKAQYEIQIEKQASREKINTITKQFQDERKSLEEQFQKQINKICEENEHKIAILKEKYADVDLKLDLLKKTIKEREKEVAELRSQCRQKESQSRGQQIPWPPEYLGIKKKRKILPKVKWILVCIVSIFLILLIGHFSSVGIHYFNGKERKKQNQEMPLETKTEIYIKNGENDDIKAGEVYHIFVKGNTHNNEKGKFVSNEFTIMQGDMIMAKHDFVGKEGRISYVIDGEEVASLQVLIK